jgi:uncharacterized membrane protein YoaK (UPF0700 family)
MFQQQETLSDFSKTNLTIWMAMAFQAGALNTGGFLACHRFVSHVTGFGTLVGTEAARGDVVATLGMVAVPGFFISGAMISAFFVDRRIQRGIKPLYPFVMFLVLILSASVLSLGLTGFFGPFGDTQNLMTDYVLLAALCLACGLQNATVTSSFGAVVRTSHLTGITTDLGIGIVRIFTHSHKIQPRLHEIRANWIRAGIIFFFIMGSFFSAKLYLHAQYWGFLIPTSIATILFFWSAMRFTGHFKMNQTSSTSKAS